VAPEEEVVRGGKADEILNAALFVEAKKAVLDGITAKMKVVQASDTVMHTRLIMMLQCWNALEGYLENVRQTGEIAQFQVQQEEERKRSMFEFFNR
jgi:hypothetical protein